MAEASRETAVTHPVSGDVVTDRLSSGGRAICLTVRHESRHPVAIFAVTPLTL